MILSRHPNTLTGADPGHWNSGIVLTLAELAGVAYSPGHVISPALLDAGWDHGWLIEERNAQAVVAWSDAAIVLAVRGSDLGAAGQHWTRRIMDWRHNARSVFRRRWMPYIPHGVGVGWRRQAIALLPGVLRALRSAVARRPGRPLFVVGHSAGAPIALDLVAAIDAEGFRPPRLIVTLSSPRNFGEDGAKWFDQQWPQTWRVIPTDLGVQDLVTRVPRSAWPVGAWHVGQPKILARSVRTDGMDSEVHLFETEAEWERLRARHPVGWPDSWRIASRLAAGVGVHPVARVVGMLREMEAGR